VALAGNVAVETIVAPGMPVRWANPMIATRCHGNVLHEVDGRAPLEVLRELHPSLPPRDQELFRHSLFLGVEMRQADRIPRGRAAGAQPHGDGSQDGRPGGGRGAAPMQVVQFLLRDARTAEGT